MAASRLTGTGKLVELQEDAAIIHLSDFTFPLIYRLTVFKIINTDFYLANSNINEGLAAEGLNKTELGC